MNEEEFKKEWDKKRKKIGSENKNSSPRYYIKVVNNKGGYILAHEYIFACDDLVLFAVRANSKLVHTGGEHLKNIKKLSISFGWVG